MRSVNSYQDILTPEEEEEREIARRLEMERRQEAAEYRAEVMRDRDGWEDNE